MEGSEREEVYVKTFGTFAMYRSGRILPEEAAGKGQVLRLFLLLLCEDEQDVGIRREKLREYLFEKQDLDCANALRVTVTRLRKQLEEVPELSELKICYREGWYWLETGNLSVITDGQKMERLCEEARDMIDSERKLTLLLEACHLYSGEFLPDMSGEDWVEVKRSSYQELYVCCAEEAAELLEQEERYEELLSLSADVLQVYSAEEWEGRRIESLIGLRRYREARKAYNSAAANLFEQYPSKAQLRSFRRLGTAIEQAEQEAEDVRESLLDGLEKSGACSCSWPGFVDCFHMYVGMVNRGYIHGYLLVCTITSRQEREPVESGDARYYMQTFCDLLSKQLRKCDCYTVHSLGRILILLSGTDKKGLNIVIKRIKGGFWKENGQKASVRIQAFRMSELSEQAEARRVLDMKDLEI